MNQSRVEKQMDESLERCRNPLKRRGIKVSEDRIMCVNERKTGGKVNMQEVEKVKFEMSLNT